MLKMVAFDYGAGSGRAILGQYDGQGLTMSEVHRFTNEPVAVGGSLYWDLLRLYHELKQGLLHCVQQGHGDLACIAIDTWGVDFGLLDSRGALLGHPYHYRDGRTDGMIEFALQRLTKSEIYQYTGIAFQKFNTLYQLLAMRQTSPEILEQAATLLFMPDLLTYFLTGERVTEYTIASTSQMVNARTREWAWELLNRLELPGNLLTPVIQPGTMIGPLTPAIRAELNLGAIPVAAVAEHDTASAVLAVPATGDFVYLSSGTWSLLGVETSAPVLSETAMTLNYTNEGGVRNTYRLLKNVMGLWLLQECKRVWDRSGAAVSLPKLDRLAGEAKAFGFLIDPDDDLFYLPGGMPDKIREYCRRTGQPEPREMGETVRCIMESLALKYRMTIEGLERIVGKALPVIHVVGGGSKIAMLNQFTANATGKPVMAGPVEATALGNLGAQLMALGELSQMVEVRQLIRSSCEVREYHPQDTAQWDEAYGRFKTIVARGLTSGRPE